MNHFYITRTKKILADPRVNNERGTALVLTMVLLLLMGILGNLALTSSTRELKSSGGQNASVQAFCVADRAIEYAMVAGSIYDSIGSGSVALTGNHATLIAAGADNSGLVDGAANQVQFREAGPLPPGSGSDPTYFQSRYYTINVTGEGPQNSSVRLEAEVARIVPK